MRGQPERAYLPHEGLDATGTTVDLVESDLTNDLGAVLSVKGKRVLISMLSCGPRRSGSVHILSQLLDLLELLGQLRGEGLLEGLASKTRSA